MFESRSLRATAIALGLAILVISIDARAGDQGLVPTNRRERTQVVFVCEHGTVKSLVAMEHFNRKAQARGLPYRALARGMAPGRTVPQAVRAGLRSDGFKTSAFVPQRFRASDLDHAVLVISFDQDVTGIAGGNVRHLTWDNLPAVLTDYSRGRDAIVARIDFLIDELARRNAP